MYHPFQSSRNRRREPEHRLEARLRSAANTRRRRAGLRLLPWLLIVALVLGGGVALLGVARQQWLYRVPAFALKTIEIRRDGALSESEILATANLRPNLNTLALDLPALQARLHRHPRIERAEIRRELPGTLRINIHERFPVARVRPGNPNAQTQLDTFYLVDETGFTLMPFRPGRALADIIEAEATLPVLVGVATTNFIPGLAVQEVQTMSALRFLAAFETSVMAGLTEILTLDLSSADDIIATTSSGSRITFGRRNFDPDFSVQLRRWQAVHEDCTHQGRVIGTLDVSVMNNAPLRWLDLAQVPPTLPSTPKVKRVKPARRHA